MDHLAQATRPFEEDTEVVNGVATIQGVEAVFANTVAVAIGLAGVALFIMLIVGGLKYITSAGNPKNAEAASKTITYAILGLVFIALAYWILVLISDFTGVDITVFSIVN